MYVMYMYIHFIDNKIAFALAKLQTARRPFAPLLPRYHFVLAAQSVYENLLANGVVEEAKVSVMI